VPTTPTRDLSPDGLARERSILADARALRHEVRAKKKKKKKKKKGLQGLPILWHFADAGLAGHVF
jgi:hypothetical protein